MAPTCDRCACAGRGRCGWCRRIIAAVLRESAPPARRDGIRPARTN